MLTRLSQGYISDRFTQLAASIHRISLGQAFCERWLMQRLFDDGCRGLRISVSPTREFCFQLVMFKINHTLSFPLDNLDPEFEPSHVGEACYLTRRVLLKALCRVMSDMKAGEVSDEVMYRFVLDNVVQDADTCTIPHARVPVIRCGEVVIVPALLSRSWRSVHNPEPPFSHTMNSSQRKVSVSKQSLYAVTTHVSF